jgi:hypothetical protein
MDRIKYDGLPAGIKQAVERFATGWQIQDCGPDMNPGLRDRWGGRANVLVTHPLDAQTGCTLTRTCSIPAGKETLLRLVVGHDPQGDFELIVRAAGKELLRKPVSPATCQEGPWLEQIVDLSQFAGQEVTLELVNQPTGWAYEAAYWAEIAIVSQ